MTQHLSVESPRIVRSPNIALRALAFLLALVALGVAAGAAYFAGMQAERAATKPLVDGVHAIERERDALAEQVAGLKQQSVVVKQSQQIDREAFRNLSEQVKGAQDKRLAAEKELSFLRRLIQEGGGGILQPKDFKLEESETQGDFGYSFTIQQLIQDFGESKGSVDMRVIGKRGGKEAALSLSDLKGSEPITHTLKLKHFQVINGMIRIPKGFVPENLVVDIKPESAKLTSVSETFPWSPEQ